MDGDNTRVLTAFADADQIPHCMKCEQPLEIRDIAMLVRTSPKDAFSTWCASCTRWIMQHAANDLDLTEGTFVAVLF